MNPSDNKPDAVIADIIGDSRAQRQSK